MQLNAQERKVLCGLSKYSDLPLRAIAEKIDINYWALYKIVERLRDRGIIREIAIPNFQLLDYELFVVSYGNLTKKKLLELKSIKKSELFKNASKVFYGLAESYRGFMFGLSKNYTELKKMLILTERYTRITELLKDNDIKLVILPLELARMPILFDYSDLLCRDAGMQTKISSRYGQKSIIVPKKPLTNRERRAMMELVANPTLSLNALSEQIGATVQTASKIKKKLYEEGWLIRRIIPNLRVLGYDVLVFAHWRSNPKQLERMESRSYEELDVDISSIVFLAYDMLEGIALAPFRNLRESREIISFFENFGERTGVLVEEPNIQFLSLQESVMIRDHNYRVMLKNL